jgi:hypothetical protein
VHKWQWPAVNSIERQQQEHVMATRDSTSDRFTNANQARIEGAEHLTGISAALSQAAELGQQVLELQQALLGGVARAQGLEAKRLAALHGEDDPRIARAAARAQLLQELRAEAGARAQDVGRFAEASQRDGTFHGYVIQPDGAPAEAYTVQMEVSDVSSKRTQGGKTKTDPTGYFRIDAGATDQPAGGLQRMVERFARAASMDDDATADDVGARAAAPVGGTETPTGTGTATETGTAVTSKVEVLDQSGRVVLEDPMPPTFDGGSSEFRYYVLTEKSAAPAF